MRRNIPFLPFGERVLVRRVEAAKSVGGIIIPDTAQEKPRCGLVVALGTGVPDFVSENMLVMFGKHSGTDLHIEDEEYVLLRAEEIYGAMAGKDAIEAIEREGVVTVAGR